MIPLLMAMLSSPTSRIDMINDHVRRAEGINRVCVRRVLRREDPNVSELSCMSSRVVRNNTAS